MRKKTKRNRWIEEMKKRDANTKNKIKDKLKYYNFKIN
jgi:hypothetical protein